MVRKASRGGRSRRDRKHAEAQAPAPETSLVPSVEPPAPRVDAPAARSVEAVENPLSGRRTGAAAAADNSPRPPSEGPTLGELWREESSSAEESLPSSTVLRA